MSFEEPRKESPDPMLRALNAALARRGIDPSDPWGRWGALKIRRAKRAAERREAEREKADSSTVIGTRVLPPAQPPAPVAEIQAPPALEVPPEPAPPAPLAVGEFVRILNTQRAYGQAGELARIEKIDAHMVLLRLACARRIYRLAHQVERAR